MTGGRDRFAGDVWPPAKHAAALAIFAALAVWCTFPLALQIGSAVPGEGPGDNVTFVWNLWWFQQALGGDASVFQTPMLFAPAGTQLVLHTHTALQALLASAARPLLSTLGAHNLVLLMGLAANGLAAYALAFRYTRRAVASIVAGLLFAASAYIQLHSLGHFNLAHAWVIPCGILALMAFVSRPSGARGLLLAMAAAAVTYSDYYYTLYCAALSGLWLISASTTVAFERAPRSFPRLARAALVLAGADVALIIAILATGGAEIRLAGADVSMHGVRNPLTVLWALLAIWVFLRWPVRVSIRRRELDVAMPGMRRWLPVAAVYLLAIAPLIYWSMELLRSGDYVTQRVLWRSSPPGVDLGTVVLGHPHQAATGGVTRAMYARLGIDVMEQSAWIGFVPLLLLIFGPSAWRALPGARFWRIAGFAFFLLALGPFLQVFGVDTGIPLPHAVLRYVPILSNARIPGRAIVVVQLALCVLVALALSREGRGALRPATRRALVAILLLEALPGRLPLYGWPAEDKVDRVLRSSPGGAVAELPTGLRDGFGEVGLFDHRALAHQMIHGHPIVGGFVARLAPRVRKMYVESPFLSSLLETSVSDAKDLPGDSAGEAAALGIRYLVVNRDALPERPPLSREAIEQAGFRFVASDGARELYRSPH